MPQFAAVLDNNLGMLAWTLVGLGITGAIIYAGVQDGIERAVTIMMPLMFLLLLGLAAYNYVAGGFDQALRWLFTPDFSKINFGTCTGGRSARHSFPSVLVWPV